MSLIVILAISVLSGAAFAQEEGMNRSFSKQELAEMEATAQPISPEAKVIRSQIAGGFLEPPDLVFISHVDAIIASIGAGRVLPPDYTLIRNEIAIQRTTVEDYRLAMHYWICGWERERAKRPLLVDPAIVDEVYEALGASDEEKKAVLKMIVARLDPVHRDLTRPNEIYQRLGTWEPENPANLEEHLFHDVTRLDLGTWKTVPNIKIMLRNIGVKDRLQEAHCWIGDPEDIPKLKARVDAISDWLEGKTGESGTREIVVTLGDKDAYREKVWLVATLLNLLETHARDERVTELIK